MTCAVKGGVTYSFTYNDEGVRTSKTVNGVTTTYYWNGTQLIAEATSGNITVYVYDVEGEHAKTVKIIYNSVYPDGKCVRWD